MNMNMVPARWNAGEIGHGFQTLPAMLAVIVGALDAIVAISLGSRSYVAVVVAVGSFTVSVVGLAWSSRQTFSAFVRHMPTRFPSTVGQSES